MANNEKFIELMKEICPYCEGEGSRGSRICKKCKGSGYVVSNQTDSVEILDEDDGEI